VKPDLRDSAGDAGLEEARLQALAAAQPLPRRVLPTGILVLLWVLRIYVLIAVPLVVYAFFHALRH